MSRPTRSRAHRVRSGVSGLLRNLIGDWASYREAPVAGADLRFQMEKNSIPSIGFLLMLSLSAVIATLGLIADSAPAIIGAMIIAPLMSPIVSAAFGIAATDARLVVRSVLTITLGTVLVIAIAYAGVQIVGARIAGDEILARTAPSYLDLGVALAAGCAGAFAQTRPSIGNSVAGVAIAVALVPPLAVTGIGLGLGVKATSETGLALGEFGPYSGGTDIAAGAFLLFVTNLFGITIVAALVFIVLRYGNWLKALAALLVITIASLTFMPSLGRALREIYVENRVARLHVKTKSASSLFEERTVRIDRLNVAYRDGLLHVSIDLFATRDSLGGAQARLDAFRELLSAELGEPVVIEIDVVPIDLLEFRSESPAAAEPEG